MSPDTQREGEPPLSEQAKALADAMLLLRGEHPSEVYTDEGYRIWLEGVAAAIVKRADSLERERKLREALEAWEALSSPTQKAGE